jgi:hypothetical protein
MKGQFQPHSGALGTAFAPIGCQTNPRSRIRRASFAIAAGVLSAALLPSGARALDVTWDGTTGDWNLPTNWDTDAVPTDLDDAVISNDGTANITAAPPTVNGVRVGDAAGSAGTVNHSAGTLTVNDAIRVGVNGGTGTYGLSGTGSLSVHNEFNVGNGGTGTLNVTGGTITKLAPTVAGSGDQWMNVGRHAGGNGTFNLSGGTVQVDAGNVFLVGRDGASGTVNQTGGSLNVDGELNLGDFAPAAGPTAVYNISNGNLTADVINVGAWNNANGTLNISGTAKVHLDNVLQVGRSGDNGSTNNGTVNQTGGEVVVTNGVRIGVQGADSGGTNGVYTMSGGTLRQPNVNVDDGNTWSHIGSGGPSTAASGSLPRTGTFNLSGGAVSLHARTHVGLGTGSDGTVNQTGGSFEVRGHEMIIADSGKGTYNISAGSLRTLSTNHDMLVGHWDNANGALNVSGTGLVETTRDLVVGNGRVAPPAEVDPGPTVGVVTQTGGAVNVGRRLLMGNARDATGTYNLSGGNLTQADVPDIANGDNWSRIGGEGKANFNITGGTASFDARLIMAGSATGTANLTQTGGTFEVRRGEFTLGDQGTATYNISAGTLRTLNPDNGNGDTSGHITVGQWDNSNGTLNVSGTAVVESAANLQIADGRVEAASRGRVSQSGGTLTVTGNLTMARTASGTATYALSGGVLDLTDGDIVKGDGTATFSFTGGELRNLRSSNMPITQEGGTFAVGTGVGTSTINGNYTLGPTGRLLIDLASDGSSDVLDVKGLATLTGLLALDTPGTALIPAGTTFTVLTPDSLTGVFSNSGLLFADNNQVFTISYAGGDGNDVVLTATNQVIPEPGVMSILGLAAGAGLLRRRSRRR